MLYERKSIFVGVVSVLVLGHHAYPWTCVLACCLDSALDLGGAPTMGLAPYLLIAFPVHRLPWRCAFESIYYHQARMRALIRICPIYGPVLAMTKLEDLLGLTRLKLCWSIVCQEPDYLLVLDYKPQVVFVSRTLAALDMRLPSRLGNRTKRLITEQLLDTEGLAHHQRLDLVHALLDFVVYHFLRVLALNQKFNIFLFVALR